MGVGVKEPRAASGVETLGVETLGVETGERVDKSRSSITSSRTEVSMLVRRMAQARDMALKQRLLMLRGIPCEWRAIFSQASALKRGAPAGYPATCKR